MIFLSHQGNLIATHFEFIFYMTILMGGISLLLRICLFMLRGKSPEKTLFGIKYKYVKIALWFLIVAFILVTTLIFKDYMQN